MIPKRLPRIITPNLLYWLAELEPRCRTFLLTDLRTQLYRREGHIPAGQDFAVIDKEGLTCQFDSFRQLLQSMSLEDAEPKLLKIGRMPQSNSCTYSVGQAVTNSSTIKLAMTNIIAYIDMLKIAYMRGTLHEYFWDPYVPGKAPVDWGSGDFYISTHHLLGKPKLVGLASAEYCVDAAQFPIYFTAPFAIWAACNYRLALAAATHMFPVYNEKGSRSVIKGCVVKGHPHLSDNLLNIQNIFEQPGQFLERVGGSVVLDFNHKESLKLFTLYYEHRTLPPQVSADLIRQTMNNFVLQHELDQDDLAND